MVTVEPLFLALTSTPSIAPSSAELTWPVSATPGELSAPMKLDAKKKPHTIPTAIAVAKNIFFRMGVLSVRSNSRSHCGSTNLELRSYYHSSLILVKLLYWSDFCAAARLQASSNEKGELSFNESFISLNGKTKGCRRNRQKNTQPKRIR